MLTVLYSIDGQFLYLFYSGKRFTNNKEKIVDLT